MRCDTEIPSAVCAEISSLYALSATAGNRARDRSSKTHNHTRRNAMLYSYAMLTVDQLKAIQKLEEELGKTLVAFQGQDIDISELAPEELKRIEDEEKKLGLSLVSVVS